LSSLSGALTAREETSLMAFGISILLVFVVST
jgi:hypothetical protein